MMFQRVGEVVGMWSRMVGGMGGVKYVGCIVLCECSLVVYGLI